MGTTMSISQPGAREAASAGVRYLARLLAFALALALTLGGLGVASAQSAALDEEIDLAMGAFDEQPFEASLSWSSLDLEDDPLDRAPEGRQPFEQEPPAAQSDFGAPLQAPPPGGQQPQIPCNPQVQTCP